MDIFINGRFLSQRRTGIQRYALEMLLALDALLSELPNASGLRVTLVAPRGTVAPAFRRIRFEARGPFSGQLWEQATLPAISRNALLVNFGMTGPLLKTNQAVTLHDASVFAVPEAFSKPFRFWYYFALPILARRCRYLMTVSEFSRRELVRFLGPCAERALVTGEGWQHVTRAIADPSIIARSGLGGRPFILAVGSLAPYKNVGLIVQALEHVGHQLDFDAVIVGPCDRAVFKDCGLAGSSRLRHLGHVSDGELRALYENATAFVHASRYEGFGIPPLEAMALGCPVLTSNAAAIPEVCGDAALYFDPNRAEQLAELLGVVLSKTEIRETLVSRGLRQAQRHSWSAAARSLLAVFEQAEQGAKCVGSRQPAELAEAISTTSIMQPGTIRSSATAKPISRPYV